MDAHFQGMTKRGRSVEAIVDEQISRWRGEQAATKRDVAAVKERPWVVTMSHAFGAGGAEIATLAGRQLELPVYDREVLQHIAKEGHVQMAVVETLDQNVVSRFEEFVASVLTGSHFDRNDYLALLARTVGALWEHGPCIIAGHGCVHLVPRAHALAVRTIAPRELRVKRVAEREGIALAEAEERVEEEDRERAAYHRRYFDTDVEDSTQYDLVVNTAEMSPRACANLVVLAYRQRFTHPV